MYTSKLFLVAAYPRHLLSFLMFQCITTTCHLSCMFLSLVGFQFFCHFAFLFFFSFTSTMMAIVPVDEKPTLKDKKIFYTYLCDVKKTVSSTSIARKYILIKKVSNLIKIIMKKKSVVFVHSLSMFWVLFWF